MDINRGSSRTYTSVANKTILNRMKCSHFQVPDPWYLIKNHLTLMTILDFILTMKKMMKKRESVKLSNSIMSTRKKCKYLTEKHKKFQKNLTNRSHKKFSSSDSSKKNNKSMKITKKNSRDSKHANSQIKTKNT